MQPVDDIFIFFCLCLDKRDENKLNILNIKSVLDEENRVVYITNSMHMMWFH